MCGGWEGWGRGGGGETIYKEFRQLRFHSGYYRNSILLSQFGFDNRNISKIVRKALLITPIK